jgi:hypothetical protein
MTRLSLPAVTEPQGSPPAHEAASEPRQLRHANHPGRESRQLVVTAAISLTPSALAAAVIEPSRAARTNAFSWVNVIALTIITHLAALLTQRWW